MQHHPLSRTTVETVAGGEVAGGERRADAVAAPASVQDQLLAHRCELEALAQGVVKGAPNRARHTVNETRKWAPLNCLTIGLLTPAPCLSAHRVQAVCGHGLCPLRLPNMFPHKAAILANNRVVHLDIIVLSGGQRGYKAHLQSIGHHAVPHHLGKALLEWVLFLFPLRELQLLVQEPCMALGHEFRGIGLGDTQQLSANLAYQLLSLVAKLCQHTESRVVSKLALPRGFPTSPGVQGQHSYSARPRADNAVPINWLDRPILSGLAEKGGLPSGWSTSIGLTVKDGQGAGLLSPNGRGGGGSPVTSKELVPEDTEYRSPPHALQSLSDGQVSQVVAGSPTPPLRSLLCKGALPVASSPSTTSVVTLHVGENKGVPWPEVEVTSRVSLTLMEACSEETPQWYSITTEPVAGRGVKECHS